MTKAMLIDVSKCTACRACQVACKAWNDLPGEVTVCLGCYDNPHDLSPDTWNRIAFWETEQRGKLAWVFRPVRCMHCTDAPCVRVCPTSAHERKPGHNVMEPPKNHLCMGPDCAEKEASCVFQCPVDALTVGPNPEMEALGDPRWTAHMIESFFAGDFDHRGEIIFFTNITA